jgi:GntR family transcriptional repressor for pyruvate dehydrogenase complex
VSQDSARPGFSRLKLVSRPTQVREQLEQAIRRGDYVPGDRLPSERELSDLFGVSRISVREALRSLEAVGLVEVRHGYGTVVIDAASRASRDLRRWVQLHRDEALDLLLVRGALDELAAGEAAGRNDDVATAAVRSAHEAFGRAAEEQEPVDRLRELDVAFHMAVARASGSALLASLLADLHDHLAESRSVGFRPLDRPRRSAREHAAIVDAIERGDRAAAAAATATHIAHVRQIIAAEPQEDGI